MKRLSASGREDEIVAHLAYRRIDFRVGSDLFRMHEREIEPGLHAAYRPIQRGARRGFQAERNVRNAGARQIRRAARA